jgi:hypothetical protein
MFHFVILEIAGDQVYVELDFVVALQLGVNVSVSFV